MKKISLSFLIVSAFLFVLSSCKKDRTEANLESENDTISYMYGVIIGKDLKTQIDQGTFKPSAEALAIGLQNVIAGDELMFDEKEIQQKLEAFQMKMMSERQQKMNKASEPNKAAGAKFLAENKTKEGVKETASGLQYKVITEGKGDSPKETDSVVVNYKGTLLNGTVFDDSYTRGEPAGFRLKDVIPGWTEGLQLMKPGAKYMFWIPSDLAYGDHSQESIPGGSLLVFEVELIKVFK